MNAFAPEVSVLMPVYNGDRWLGEAISSILSQSFLSFEFIIIDDGSTDRSLQVARRYASADSRMQVLAKKNSGIADTLNFGLKVAKGKWIVRLDADDIAEPDRISHQMEVARTLQDVVLIGSDMMEINQDGAIMGVQKYPTTDRKLVNNLLSNKRFFAHPSVCFRADAARQVGCYRERVAEAQDRDLWFRLSNYGQLASVNKPLIRYRRHSQQSTLLRAKDQLFDSFMADVSYWLRRSEMVDPLDASAADFEIFRHWLGCCILDDGVNEFEAYRVRVRNAMRSHMSSPGRQVTAGVAAVSQPYYMMLSIFRKVFGDQRPRRWASKWPQGEFSDRLASGILGIQE